MKKRLLGLATVVALVSCVGVAPASGATRAHSQTATVSCSGGTGYVVGSLIGVLVYGTIKTVISFQGAEQSWTRIIVGLMLLLFIVVQRIIVFRSERRR